MPGDTKTALLDSAERAARTRGFDGFSYADLSQDVGIRKASIHHHFPTKAALSVELMKRYTADLQAACVDIEASAETGGARLVALINRYRQALDGGQSLCLCVSFSNSRESLPNDVVKQIAQFRAMMIDWITTTFETGKQDKTIRAVLAPEKEAAAALAQIEGAQLAARAEENPARFDAAIALLKDRLAI